MGGAAGVGLLVGGARPAAAEQAGGGAAMDARNAFVTAARAGNLTFAAADARGADGSLGGAQDVAGQARRTMEHLRNTLRMMGQSPDGVVSLLVLLTRYDDLDAVSRVVSEHFADAARYPATTYLGVSSLDGGCAVRVDAIATTSAARDTFTDPGVPLAAGARCHGVRVGDLYFLSGIDAGDTAASPATLDEMSRQTTTVLDRMDAILARQGLALSDVGRTFMFMSDLRVRDGYSQGRRARYQGVFALDAFPANSGIGVPQLGRNVLLRSVAIASNGPKAYVSSDKVRLTPGLFSQSVQFGDWLFLAGQDAIDLNNQTLAIGDVAEQTTISLQHIKDVMEAAGGTLEDVIKTTVYVVQGQDLGAAVGAYRRFFAENTRGGWLPAGLTLGVMELATDCLVEIDAVGYLGPR
jgi:2-iminobutanoate/2-iminopropanoate deaminase